MGCRLRDRLIHEGTRILKGGLKRATQESRQNRGDETAREALQREGAIQRDSGRIGQNCRVGTPEHRRFRNPLRGPNRLRIASESSTLNATIIARQRIDATSEFSNICGRAAAQGKTEADRFRARADVII